MREEYRSRLKTPYARLASTGMGTAIKGKNKMMKDHYTNMRKYEDKIIEIETFISENKENQVYLNALQNLIFYKENIEHSIKSLNTYKNTDTYFLGGDKYLDKEVVLSLARKVLQKYDSLIKDLQSVLDSGVHV